MHPIPGQKIAFANTLRGLSALCILIYHYAVFFWATPAIAMHTTLPLSLFTSIETPWYVTRFFSATLFNIGPYSLGLFFLISGFVIPFSLTKTTQKEFFVQRFFRIVPVYLVGFSITLLCLFFGEWYFDVPFAYKLKHIVFHYIPGFRDLFYWMPNIDAVVWTLEIEVKFYLLCGIFIHLFKKRSLKVFLIPLGLLLIALLARKFTHSYSPKGKYYAYETIYVAQFLIYTFIGVAYYYLYQKIIRLPTAIGLSLLLFYFFYALISKSIYGVYLFSMSLSMVTFLVGYYFPRVFPSNRLFNYLADVSYPLYAIHCVGGWVFIRILLDFNLPAWLAITITTVCAYALATVLHHWIEVPMQQYGKDYFKRKKPADDTALQYS